MVVKCTYILVRRVLIKYRIVLPSELATSTTSTQTSSSFFSTTVPPNSSPTIMLPPASLSSTTSLQGNRITAPVIGGIVGGITGGFLILGALISYWYFRPKIGVRFPREQVHDSNSMQRNYSSYSAGTKEREIRNQDAVREEENESREDSSTAIGGRLEKDYPSW